MKKACLLALAVLSVSAIAYGLQAKFTFERTYKLGDKQTYGYTMEMEGSMTMKMQAKMTQEVTKVYDDGDADITATTSDMTVSMNGQTFNPPASPKPVPMKVDKYGGLVGDLHSNGPMDIMGAFMKSAEFRKNGLTVGQTVPFKANDEKSGMAVSGTVTLDSVDANEAVLKTVMDMTTKQTGDKPMHMVGTSKYSVSDHVMTHMDMEMTGIVSPSGPSITSVKMVMDLQK